MYEEHLKTCEYCQNSNKNKVSKPTIFVKSASSYSKQKKLTELSAIIKGISYTNLVFPNKGASANNTGRRPSPIEKEIKLKALGKLIRG